MVERAVAAVGVVLLAVALAFELGTVAGLLLAGAVFVAYGALYGDWNS